MASRTLLSGLMFIAQEAAADMLLARGACIDGVPGREPTLIRSCRGDRGAGPLETMTLLSRGADVILRGRDERAPLHYAARGRSREVWDLLIRHGADPNLRDDKGRTAFELKAK